MAPTQRPSSNRSGKSLRECEEIVDSLQEALKETLAKWPRVLGHRRSGFYEKQRELRIRQAHRTEG